MGNKVTVDVEADPQGKAQTTFNNLNQTINQFAQNTTRACGSVSSAFTVADKDVDKLRADLERTRDAAQKLEIQFLKTAQARGASSPFGAAASAQAQEARTLAQASQVGLTTLDAGVTQGTFAKLTTGAADAKVVLGDLRQEKVNLDRALAEEPRSGSSRIFDVTQSILLRDVIKGVIKEIGELGEAWIKSQQQAEISQRNLINSAVDFHASIQENIKAAKELQEANSLALTGPQAANIHAAALGLATKAGRETDVAAIEQSAIDLAARRGLSQDNVPALLEQLRRGQGGAFEQLTGQEDVDALNRYANAHHKLTEELTKEEQAFARLDLIIRQGQRYKGEAIRQTQTFSAGLEATFKDVGYTTFIMPEKYAITQSLRGWQSARQAWNENNSPSAPQATDLEIFGNLQSVFSSVGEERQGALKQQVTDFSVSFDKALGAHSLGQKQQALAKLKIELQDLQGVLKPEAFERFAQGIDKALTHIPTEDFSNRLGSAFRNPDINERLGKLQDLKQELQSMRGVLNDEDFEKFSTRIDDGLLQLNERFSALRTSAAALLETLSARAAHDNPFVKIFGEGAQSIESIRQKFAPLGDGFVEQMVRMQGAATAVDLAVARFDSNLTALKYRQDARRLREPLLGLTGPDDRQLDVLKSRVAAAVNIPKLTAERDALDPAHQFRYAFEIARERKRIFDDQLRALQSLQSFAGGALGRSSNKMIDEQILSLTGQIDPRVLANSPDPIIRAARDARRGALGRGIEGYQQDVRESLDRARAGERLQRDAREQLRLLQASNLPQDEAIKRFLSITGQLSDKELTGDLRLGRARVDDLAAQREAAKDQAAEASRKQLDTVMKKLDAVLTDKGLKIDEAERGASVLLSIENKSKAEVQTNQLPPSPGSFPGSRD